MKREEIGEIIFWGAVACALALYALSAPHGLPWQPPAADRHWRYLVAMAYGSATLLTKVAAAVAGGLVGAIANRHFGWRVGVASALAWIVAPWVWNRAITGGRAVVLAAAVVFALWVANALILLATWKVRSAWRAKRLALELDDDTAAAVQIEEGRRQRRNGKIAWTLFGVACLFALISVSTHDYSLGEAASVYARLVVKEAGDRVIQMNGLCDEQIEREVQRKLGRRRGKKKVEGKRVEVEGRGREGETKGFYAMTGESSTPEMWAAQWGAMKPYLDSCDPFIPVLRRAFAAEGNVLGRRLQESNEQRQAWRLYLRIFDEINPGDATACTNLNAMLRQGYKVEAMTRERVRRRLTELEGKGARP